MLIPLYLNGVLRDGCTTKDAAGCPYLLYHNDIFFTIARQIVYTGLMVAKSDIWPGTLHFTEITAGMPPEIGLDGGNHPVYRALYPPVPLSPEICCLGERGTD